MINLVRIMSKFDYIIFVMMTFAKYNIYRRAFDNATQLDLN